jgi:hypothetical protein
MQKNVRRASAQIQVIQGIEEILPYKMRLVRLAERCGQPGAMHWLQYFLKKAADDARTPFLVLLRGDGTAPGELEAAALLFEYRVFGVRTGVFSTADAVGYSSVLAPACERTGFAARAAHALVDAGAQVVLATFEGEAGQVRPDLLGGPRPLLYATRQRSLRRTLVLQKTMEATLASLGKKTRFNLRYYRRRLEGEMGCEFMPKAAEALRTADLGAINQTSINPVSDSEFQRRVQSASDLPGTFLCGLRGPDGQWLSLAGGWRESGTTVLFWQMNRAGYEKFSLGTVMRSYLLEEEVRRGARELVIYGGTPHSMRHAFQDQPLGDVVLRRKTVRAALLVGLSRRLARPDGAAGRTSFLASTLHDPSLAWMRNEPSGKRMSGLVTGMNSR